MGWQSRLTDDDGRIDENLIEQVMIGYEIRAGGYLGIGLDLPSITISRCPDHASLSSFSYVLAGWL